MKKKVRQQVFDKYGGKCAYTGKPLDDNWQVDHITPKRSWVWAQPEARKVDDLENLVPALRIVNHYKRDKDLEFWRGFLKDMHIRLKKLPKKTKVLRTEKRIKYLLEVAALFDITPDKPFSGVFYFETLTQKQ